MAKVKKPSLVSMANAKLEDVRAALTWIFDVASLEGDEWSAATVTAARRVLGESNDKLVIKAKPKVRKR